METLIENLFANLAFPAAVAIVLLWWVLKEASELRKQSTDIANALRDVRRALEKLEQAVSGESKKLRMKKRVKVSESDKK